MEGVEDRGLDLAALDAAAPCTHQLYHALTIQAGGRLKLTTSLYHAHACDRESHPPRAASRSAAGCSLDVSMCLEMQLPTGDRFDRT